MGRTLGFLGSLTFAVPALIMYFAEVPRPVGALIAAIATVVLTIVSFVVAYRRPKPRRSWTARKAAITLAYGVGLIFVGVYAGGKTAYLVSAFGFCIATGLEVIGYSDWF